MLLVWQGFCALPLFALLGNDRGNGGNGGNDTQKNQLMNSCSTVVLVTLITSGTWLRLCKLPKEGEIAETARKWSGAGCGARSVPPVGWNCCFSEKVEKWHMFHRLFWCFWVKSCKITTGTHHAETISRRLPGGYSGWDWKHCPDCPTAPHRVKVPDCWLGLWRSHRAATRGYESGDYREGADECLWVAEVVTR